MNTTAALQTTARATRQSTLLAAIAALALGAVLVFGTGFVGSSTLHSAAHDTRHAFAMPCH